MVQHLLFATVERICSTCSQWCCTALHWPDRRHTVSDIWKVAALSNANLPCTAEPKIHNNSFIWQIWIPFCLWDILPAFFEGLKLLSLTAITDSFLRKGYRTSWGCSEQTPAYCLLIKQNNNSWMFMNVFCFSLVYFEIGMLHGNQLSTFLKKNSEFIAETACQ